MEAPSAGWQAVQEEVSLRCPRSAGLGLLKLKVISLLFLFLS